MNNIVQKIAVGGVIVNDGRVLIIQRVSGDTFPDLWELPSGKKEFLENSLEAIVRETKEETGLDTKVIDTIGVFNFIVEKEDEIRDIVQVNFLLELIGSSKVKLSSEHQNFAWITSKGVDKYNISNEVKEIINKVFT